MRIKHHLICTFLILLYHACAFSEVLHWPEICNSGTLIMTNKGSERTSLWLQKFAPVLASETELEVPAKGELSINIDKLENEHYSLLHFSPAGHVTVSFKCGGNIYSSTYLEGGVITYPREKVQNVWLQNLYSDTNTVEIEFQNLAFQKVASEVLELRSLASRSFAIPENVRDWQYLKVSSSNRLTSFPLNETGNVRPVLIQAQQTKVESNAAYFLVAAREGDSDSFVVKIKDAAMTARARDLVKNPQKEKMLFAKVQKDHQGFNRNFSSIQKNLWSWSTVEVTNFADFGSIACNGQPQVLEDRVDSWLADPGQICFWNYRVKKELTPLEVATGKLQ